MYAIKLILYFNVILNSFTYNFTELKPQPAKIAKIQASVNKPVS